MKTARSKSALFLMELILSILFFAIAAAVCMQLFAASALASRRTREQSHAVTAAQSAAACVQTAAGDPDTVAKLLSGSCTADTVTVFYDAHWQPADAAQAEYTLTIQSGAESEQAQIDVRSTEETLFSLTCGWHTPLAAKGGGA